MRTGPSFDSAGDGSAPTVASAPAEPTSTTATAPPDDAVDNLAAAYLEAYSALGGDDMFPTLEQWGDLPAYLFVGTVRAVEIDRVEGRAAEIVRCESSDGVTVPGTCVQPGRDLGLLRLTVVPSEIMVSRGGPGGDLPSVGEALELTSTLAFVRTGADLEPILGPVAEAFSPGLTVVGIAVPGANGPATLGPGAWGIVADDGRLIVPMDPTWPTDAGFAPYRTLDELLGAMSAAEG